MSTSKRNPVHDPCRTLLVVLSMASCGGDPNSPGVEYMPDMYRSPAMEAYVDFGQDPYHFSEELARSNATARARNCRCGHDPILFRSKSKAKFNMPYAYPNTPEGYEAAGLGLKSPIAMTEATVEQGKVIYTKFCTHCHGEKGEGDGAVVNERQVPATTGYTAPH
jgi:mono/diheme cytochrome c family protein